MPSFNNEGFYLVSPPATERSLKGLYVEAAVKKNLSIILKLIKTENACDLPWNLCRMDKRHQGSMKVLIATGEHNIKSVLGNSSLIASLRSLVSISPVGSEPPLKCMPYSEVFLPAHFHYNTIQYPETSVLEQESLDWPISQPIRVLSLDELATDLPQGFFLHTAYLLLYFSCRAYSCGYGFNASIVFNASHRIMAIAHSYSEAPPINEQFTAACHATMKELQSHLDILCTSGGTSLTPLSDCLQIYNDTHKYLSSTVEDPCSYQLPVLMHAARAAIAAGCREAQLSRGPDTYILTGCILATFREPCLFCSMCILHSRISILQYVIPRTNNGGANQRIMVPTLPGVNHSFPVVSGFDDLVRTFVSENSDYIGGSSHG